MSRFKNEEMVPLADTVWVSFKRDLAEMEAENSTLNDAYLEDFKVKCDKVRDLEQADSMLITQKGITTQLYNTADGIKKEVKLFQLVLKKAALDTKIVSVLLRNITSRNMEGALVNIKSIEQIVAANVVLLNSKGMKTTFSAFLSNSFTQLTDLSNQQTQIMKNRKLVTDANQGSYAALNTIIVEVCKVGSILYFGQVKADEYNITKLLTKLHSTAHKAVPVPQVV